MDAPDPVDTSTPESLRKFCRWCLNPGIGGLTRSPEQLARIMPDWVSEPLAAHVPHLGAHVTRISHLRDAVEAAEAAVAEAQVRFAADLRLWIEDEPAPPAEADEAAALDEAPGLDEEPAGAPTGGSPVRERWPCPKCNRNFRLSPVGLMTYHHGMTPTGYSTHRACAGVGEFPSVRPGDA